MKAGGERERDRDRKGGRKRERRLVNDFIYNIIFEITFGNLDFHFS